MNRVFVDTNVILDVLLQRDGFWQNSMKIFQLTHPIARQAIEMLLNLFEIVGIGNEDLRSALSITIDDFEDALQAHCAIKIGADAIITRDIEGFPGIDIAVMTPTDFIK